MAPGINGTNSGAINQNQGTPRSTGTVPKIKTRNELSIHHNQQQQLLLEHHLPYQHLQTSTLQQFQNSSPSPSSSSAHRKLLFHNIPKNQVLSDWLNLPASPQKNCGNRGSSPDIYVADGVNVQDNRYGNPILHSIRQDVSSSEVNALIDSQPVSQLHRYRMNGHDMGRAGSSAPSPSPSDGPAQGRQILGADNFRSAPPLQDGLSYTSDHNGLPEGEVKKNNAPNTPDRAHVESSLSQIQEYIKQTTTLMGAIRANGVESDKIQFETLKNILENLYDSKQKLQYLLAAFDKLNNDDARKNFSSSPISDISGSALNSFTQSPPDAMTFTGSSSSIQSGPVSKSADPIRRSEIKIKLEESMKNLQSLQEEQAALIAKRNQAKEKLQEMQREQNFLLSLASGCSNGPSAMDIGMDGRGNFQLEEHCNVLNCKNPVEKSDSKQQSPAREHKPREMQRKKRLPSDHSASYKELSAEDEVKEQASSEDSAVEDAADEYAEARAQVRLQSQIVRNKTAEINSLRAQLDHVRSLVSGIHRKDTAVSSNSSSVADRSWDEQLTDQTANFEQQPRNAADCGDATSEIKHKSSAAQLELEQNREKLRYFQELLSRINEYRSAGVPVPDNILEQFSTKAQNYYSVQPVAPSNAETDGDEDDEPESSSGWNSKSTLAESASGIDFVRDLRSYQPNRDNLITLGSVPETAANTIMQSDDHQTKKSALAAHGTNTNDASRRPRNNNNMDDPILQRRIKMLSELQEKCQQLQKEISSDPHINSAVCPILDATRDAMDVVTSHVLSPYSAENQVSVLDVGRTSPVRNVAHMQQDVQNATQAITEQQGSQASPTVPQQYQPEAQLSFSRVKRNTQAETPRAVWSSSISDIGCQSPGNGPEMRQISNSQPAVQNAQPSSSPSPNNFSQHTTEVQNRLATLSQSYQSLMSESLDGGATPRMPWSVMPSMQTANIVPQPPSPGSASHDREMYYQQLLAASQFQQQQVLLTAINQCFHLLTLQHELHNVSSTVQVLSSALSQFTNSGSVPTLPGFAATAPSGIHPAPPPVCQQWPGMEVGMGVAVGRGVTPSPVSGPATLNNQVAPGNRTNNYWDNFRSYSRQNLLSTTAKSNEGLSNSPVPLVERSHNSLRSSTPTTGQGVSNAPAGLASSVLAANANHPAPCVDSSSSTLGAGGLVGTSNADLSVDNSLSSCVVQNISRKDKRNVDLHEDIRPANEIDHRTASRVLEDAALSVCSTFSQAAQAVDVPPPPLRNVPSAPVPASFPALQARVNQINFNDSDTPPTSTVPDFPHSRNQLNNEGVPFSELSSGSNNSQSAGRVRDRDHWSNRINFNNNSTSQLSSEVPRLSSPSVETEIVPPFFHFNNVTAHSDLTTNAIGKSNSGAIKRTHLLQNGANGMSAFIPINYQRNFHAPALPRLSLFSTNSSSGPGNQSQNVTRNFSLIQHTVPNGDSDGNLRSGKTQTGADTLRKEVDQYRSRISSRSRLEDADQEDTQRDSTGDFGNLQYQRALTHCSPSPNAEVQGKNSGKNQIKESCFRIRKCVKYQPKSRGAREDPTDTSDTAFAAAAAVAAVTAFGSSFRGSPRSLSSKGRGGRRRTESKNNQEKSDPLHVIEECVSLYATELSNEDAKSSYEDVTRNRDCAAEEYEQITELLQRMDYANNPDNDHLGAVGGSVTDQQNSNPNVGDLAGVVRLFLVMVASFLNHHNNDICTSGLLEPLREFLLGLAPIRAASTSEQATKKLYFHSQVNTMLDEVLSKSQGCKVGGRSGEILSSVANVLHPGLWHLWLYDLVGLSNTDVEAEATPMPKYSFSDPPEEYEEFLRTSPLFVSHVPLSETRQVESASEWPSDGDLAEADQSHTLRPLDSEDDGENEAIDADSEADEAAEGFISASESASDPLHVHVYQMSRDAILLDSEPDVEADREDGDTLNCISVDDSDSREESIGGFAQGGERETGAIGGAGESSQGAQNNYLRTTMSQENGGDQDQNREREREQGLDCVPTKLVVGQDDDQENEDNHSQSSDACSQVLDRKRTSEYNKTHNSKDDSEI